MQQGMNPNVRPLLKIRFELIPQLRRLILATKCVVSGRRDRRLEIADDGEVRPEVVFV